MSSLFPESSGATFSPCRRYRYTLWRQWDERPPAAFIMLNPSTADETANDPTVERCQRRAQAMGYGGIRVANIFALRSTDPRALYTAEDPVGPENDHALLTLAQGVSLVICAWGSHGRHQGRGVAVRALLHAHDIPLHVLRLNQDGNPQHPLYIGYDVAPVLWGSV
jgi:hypothetical protein